MSRTIAHSTPAPSREQREQARRNAERRYGVAVRRQGTRAAVVAAALTEYAEEN